MLYARKRNHPLQNNCLNHHSAAQKNWTARPPNENEWMISLRRALAREVCVESFASHSWSHSRLYERILLQPNTLFSKVQVKLFRTVISWKHKLWLSSVLWYSWRQIKVIVWISNSAMMGKLTCSLNWSKKFTYKGFSGFKTFLNN